MQITIDNGDGRGAVDYTAAVLAEGPLTIVRELNKPTRCTASLLCAEEDLPTPSRKGRVTVANGAGTTLFTGYVVVEPAAIYAGEGVRGPVYQTLLTAGSDEWLLDKQGTFSGVTTNGLALNADSTKLLAQLTNTAQAGAGTVSSGVTVVTGGNPRAVGAFALQPAAGWVDNAANTANATYASYRAVNGSISLVPAGSVTHAVSDQDGSLEPAAFEMAYLRELANDVTLSGAEEPAAFVQEIFSGDGTTAIFPLSDTAFRSSDRTLVRDRFQSQTFDGTQWTLADAGAHLQLTARGLTMTGGNGFDGQTTLTALQMVEMGGAVVAEMSGVVFGAGSDGMLAGFYDGSPVLSDCFAGFRVRQSTSTNGGVTVVVPVTNGAESGTVFTPASGHAYTLRLRLFCPEMLRVPQRYYCMVDGSVSEFGALSGVNAPMQMSFEIRDEGVSSDTPVTVLYDSGMVALQNSPGACSFVAVNATNLYGSVATVELTRPGSLWVVSTLPNGSSVTRTVGLAGQGLDCEAAYGTATGEAGKVTFFAGRIPVAGERVSVFYRTGRRAVARLADAASVAAEATAGAGFAVPGVSRWLGKVDAPVARSSADCEAAASAVLAMATARSAALRGTYVLHNPAADIWPGDLLAVTQNGVSRSLLIRSVHVRNEHASPELVEYRIAYANDWATEWADGFGLKLNDAIAADVTLPSAATSGPSATAANLQGLQVVSLTGQAMQVDAGVAPPPGGGFEVRRKDDVFGVGVDQPDLVLRSPVRSFSVPRAAQTERFYVRMYDGSTPPVYSRFSSAVFVNWPLD